MDSDEDIEEFQQYRGVPATIVLINAFNPSNTETPRVSYEATCRLIKRHLRQASTHYIGVCVIGTNDASTASFTSQNITELIPLNLPNLKDFRKLIDTDITACKQAKELIMSDALWHCSKMFANCKKQLLSRTILILTRLDTPPISSDHNATFNRITELIESNIEIKIINISKTNYQPHEFYTNFLINVQRNKDVTLPEPVWDYEEIEDMMYKQSHRHLANAQLFFDIGNGFEIGVGVYSLLKSNYKPKKEDLDRDTNVILTSVNKVLKVSTEPLSNANNMSMDIDGSGDEPKKLPLLKSELLWSVDYGAEKIYFTDAEKKMIANPFGPPHLKLLGFKPMSRICKEKWFLKHGYLLYPNENKVEGSTKAFKALHAACINKSVVAICMLCTRVNSRPNIVALSPCKRPFDLNIDVGFDVIILPFVEHVRDLQIEDSDVSSPVPESHKIEMEKIINGLLFDYKPQMFENPELQSKYAAIEAKLLGVGSTFIDSMKCDIDKFKALDGESFENVFGPFGVIDNKRAGSKRPDVNNKRARMDDIIHENDIIENVKNKKVNKYTVAELKKILELKNIHNLPNIKNMKKNELVKLVYDNFN